VILFDITDPYCTLILRGIEKSLYQDHIFPSSPTPTTNAPFLNDIWRLLERRVEGLLVLANWLYLDINLLADLERGKIPHRHHRPRIGIECDQFSDG